MKVIKHWLEKLLARESLSHDEMTAMMQALMAGELTEVQAAALIVALRAKGETVEEIAAAASVMRALSQKVDTEDASVLVDTCGTGGDGQHTFNISTTVAFVVAAAGAKVAKHGGRSVTSSSGSADVLEAAGMNLAATPEQTAASIREVGVGFLFAPAHHSAMKHVVGVRKALGVRTLFNLLGPITNPAGVQRQVLGVFSDQWLEPMAQVLKTLGSQAVWVVHADDGLDEISIATSTQVCALSEDGQIKRFSVTPEDVGYERQSLATIKASTKEESLAMMHRVFDNEAGPWRDIVCLNAGAALLVAGLVSSFVDGVRLAETILASGAAKAKFAQAIAYSQA
ncbi:MAG: anthranilate phosphoribosyltransferase [Gammaproteobacteria bacterium]|nr:anthranilate phosphoribosyltransferase [Gammaproteobacteria bacterium]